MSSYGKLWVWQYIDHLLHPTVAKEGGANMNATHATLVKGAAFLQGCGSKYLVEKLSGRPSIQPHNPTPLLGSALETGTLSSRGFA